MCSARNSSDAPPHWRYNSAIEADERGVSASETMLWWEYAVFVAGFVCTVSACFVALLWRRR